MPALQQARFFGLSSVPRNAATIAVIVGGQLSSAWRRLLGMQFKMPMEMEFCCGAHLVLARRAFVVLHRVRQQHLVCEAGELWVTLDGQDADYVLARGEGMVIASNARVIVSATRPAVLRMRASSTAHDGPQPAGGGAWLWLSDALAPFHQGVCPDPDG
jgi:hypothetical protein